MNKLKRNAISVLSIVFCATAFAGIAVENSLYASAAGPSKFEVAGASIRYTKDIVVEGESKGDGIRFTLCLDETSYNTYAVEGNELGMLVLPKKLLADGATLEYGSANVGKIVTYGGDVSAWGTCVLNGVVHADMKMSIGYVWNIPADYYDGDFVVRGYIKQADAETIYTDQIERSVDYVALNARTDLEKKLETATEEEKTDINIKIGQLNGYLQAKKYTVQLKNDADNVLDTQTKYYGDTVVAYTETGYEYVWTLNGEPYDLNTPVTGDMTLVGTKQVRTVGFANRWTNLAGTLDTSGTVYEGKKTLAMHAVANGTTNEEFGLYNPFDLTAEEINALIADGYTKIRFELYSPITDTTDHNGWFTFLTQGWNTITVDLSELTRFTGQNPIYYHWTVNKDYSNMVFAITVPTILKTHTVTAELPDGTTDTVRVIDGEKFSYTANAPLGYEYVWTLNGEPYDFDAPVTGDMTLVGTKQVRTVGYANRWTSLAGRLDTSGTVYEGKKTLAMHTVANGTTNAEFGLYNPFDLTAEEINALIADGYTKIRFELYSPITDTTDHNGWFTFLTQGWNTITVDLSELTRFTGQNPIYYHWTGNKDYSNMVFAVTVPTIIK